MNIIIADSSHNKYANIICETIDNSAQERGTGIARRTPEYIINKLKNKNAVIALDGDKFAGFCYIEKWQHGKYVVHSGLIVHPDYRKKGLAKRIKKTIFEYSLQRYPKAKIFGITTGLAVMKINSDLGYKPVTFSELTDDDKFWSGCKTCTNYEILKLKERKMCLCTGMLYDPKNANKKTENVNHPFNKKVWRRLKEIKKSLFLKNKK